MNYYSTLYIDSALIYFVRAILLRHNNTSHDSKMATEPLKVGELQEALPQVVAEPKPRNVYEVGTPFNEGWLRVSDLHEIHFREMGKKDGKPVIYL